MYGLRYYFEFRDDVSPSLAEQAVYRVEILNKDYGGEVTFLPWAGVSPCVIDYPNSDQNDKLTPLRGSECEVVVLSTDEFSLADIYTDDERAFRLDVYREAELVWRGFVQPDQCRENFQNPPFEVSIRATDGLGSLKNFRYLDANIRPYIGKQTILDIVLNCLAKTDTDFDLTTGVNVYETSMVELLSADPLTQVLVNADRWRDDKNKVMSCEDVLSSICRLFGAVLFQHKGKWIMQRVAEVQSGAGIIRRTYSNTGVYKSGGTYDIIRRIGRTHAAIPIDFNQFTSIGTPYPWAVVDYTYGAFLSKLKNGEFRAFSPAVPDPAIPVSFTDWTQNPNSLFSFSCRLTGDGTIEVPYWARLLGAQLDFGFPPAQDYAYIESAPIADLKKDSVLTFSGSVRFFLIQTAPIALFFTDKNGIMYMMNLEGDWDIITDRDTPSPFYITNSQEISVDTTTNQGIGFSVTTKALPEDGTLTIRLYQGKNSLGIFFGFLVATDYSQLRLSEKKKEELQLELVGENHYQDQTDKKYSAKADYLKVYVGDRAIEATTDTLIANATNAPTIRWHRPKLLTETRGIAQIAALDFLHAHGRPYWKYESTVHASEFNYDGVYSVTMKKGRFFPMAVRSDLRSGKHDIVLAELINACIHGSYSVFQKLKDREDLVIDGRNIVDCPLLVKLFMVVAEPYLKNPVVCLNKTFPVSILIVNTTATNLTDVAVMLDFKEQGVRYVSDDKDEVTNDAVNSRTYINLPSLPQYSFFETIITMKGTEEGRWELTSQLLYCNEGYFDSDWDQQTGFITVKQCVGEYSELDYDPNDYYTS